MSCRCCIVDERNNLILECATIVVASVGSFVVFMFNGSFLINAACNGGSILLASVGIVSLIFPENSRLGHVVVGLAALISFPYLLVLYLLFAAIPTMSGNFLENAACLETNRFNFGRQQIDRSPLIASFILALVYILYMLGAAAALALKHFRIRRKSMNGMICSCSTPHPSACQSSKPQQYRDPDYSSDASNIILGATLLNFISPTAQIDNWQQNQQMHFDDYRLEPP